MFLCFRVCKKCLLLSSTGFRTPSGLLWFKANSDNSFLHHVPFWFQPCSLWKLGKISPGKVSVGADTGEVLLLTLISHKPFDLCLQPTHHLSGFQRWTPSSHKFNKILWVCVMPVWDTGSRPCRWWDELRPKSDCGVCAILLLRRHNSVPFLNFIPCLENYCIKSHFTLWKAKIKVDFYQN